MDLLRLALERGATARAAVGHLTSLLEEHGQGGACEEGGDWTYENGFLLADAGEAFVVETAGTRHWAVERVPPGKGRNISNGLSIRTGVESCSAGLKELCVAKGWWDGEGPFDWKRSVGAGGRAHAKLDVRGRERAGADHLAAAAGRVSDGSLPAGDVAGWLGWMAGVLRDEESGAARWGASGDGSSTHCPHHAPTPTPCQASASGLLTASCRRARRSRG
mmetsp:Transcript_12968/g.38289  ORF Transcript_12968/g.38289 Transcript_12968/m.38289 type:complete len:220 (+) Transcript_12968:432-1091(+)